MQMKAKKDDRIHGEADGARAGVGPMEQPGGSSPAAAAAAFLCYFNVLNIYSIQFGLIREEKEVDGQKNQKTNKRVKEIGGGREIRSNKSGHVTVAVLTCG